MQHRNQLEQIQFFYRAMRGVPDAAADLLGSDEYPAIRGTVLFYQTKAGVLVTVLASGLSSEETRCEASVFALHIHSGDACAGDAEDPFKNALTHFNPGGCSHPNHAGDLPPLFANQGEAFSVLLTNRFSVENIIGRTILLHREPDDFMTQPAGNAGKKIACGVIQRTRRCGRSPAGAL